jgi:hypothetical protein
METQFWLEMFGYLGSVLVAISLTMRSLVRLRAINSIGSLVFVVYGILIRAYPVAALNGFIFCVNAFYLTRMYRQKDYLQLLEISHDSAYLNSLLDFYKDEIREIYPDYVHDSQAGHPTYLVLRNMVPAGVIIHRVNGAQANILLDYVIPMYRDFRVGQFFYHDKAGYFYGRGVERFVDAPGRPSHAKYLERMGFRLEDGMYVLELGKEKVMKDAQM